MTAAPLNVTDVCKLAAVEVRNVPLALVHPADAALRTVKPYDVQMLAESISKIGLHTPITVRAFQRIRDGVPIDAWQIIAGHHRVEAARSLGWIEIPAIVSEVDAAQQRLWEIAENLHRAELTVQERSDYIAEWVKITGERIGPSWANSSKPGPKGAIRAAVRELGIKRTDTQRSVKIASFPKEVKEAAREAGIDDNQSALLRVAAEPSPEKQLARIRAEQEKVDAHKANRQALADQQKARREEEKRVQEEAAALIVEALGEARGKVLELLNKLPSYSSINFPLIQLLTKRVAS